MSSDRETPEQRLRGGLFDVYSRWKAIRDDGLGVSSLSTAMALAAMQALAEAYPEDRLYRELLAELEQDHGPLPTLTKRTDPPTM